LTDSPALNIHSRSVLIPLTPIQLPPSIVSVPGPGPNEPRAQAPVIDTDESDDLPPPPPGPKASIADDDNDDDDEGSDQDDDDAAPVARDPYSNLDGAFGNYVTDQPQPMAANNRGENGQDDLLF